jgi:hypothetical protein
VVEIFMTQNQVALIDDEDYELVCRFRWNPRFHGKTCYAIANINGLKHTTVQMHRLIMEATKDQLIDHKNGNGLDNRRDNLRFCNQIQNMQNQTRTLGKSKYKGVHWHTNNKNWVSRIQVSKKRISLGSFSSEKEAALAYNKAALSYFGEFAKLNEIY